MLQRDPPVEKGSAVMARSVTIPFLRAVLHPDPKAKKVGTP